MRLLNVESSHISWVIAIARVVLLSVLSHMILLHLYFVQEIFSGV